MSFITSETWHPVIVGICIGILSWITFLLFHKPIGCSTAFARTSGLIERLFKGKKYIQRPYFAIFPPQIDWEWMLVFGIFFGSLLSAVTSGAFRIDFVPEKWSSTFGETPLLRNTVAILGGIFIGFGSRWAGGCTSGHAISGTLQLALSGWIAAICFFVGGIITAFFVY